MVVVVLVVEVPVSAARFDLLMRLFCGCKFLLALFGGVGRGRDWIPFFDDNDCSATAIVIQ